MTGKTKSKLFKSLCGAIVEINATIYLVDCIKEIREDEKKATKDNDEGLLAGIAILVIATTVAIINLGRKVYELFKAE